MLSERAGVYHKKTAPFWGPFYFGCSWHSEHMEIIPAVAEVVVSGLMIGSLVLSAIFFAVMMSRLVTRILG